MQALTRFTDERKCARRIVMAVFAVLVTLSWNPLAGAQGGDRVEGIVESVEAPNAVVVRTRDRLVTVDLAALGGVTVAVTQGTKITAVGAVDPGGGGLPAARFEAPASPQSLPSTTLKPRPCWGRPGGGRGAFWGGA